MGAPACESLLDFAEALAEGAKCNRDRRRSQAAKAVWHALRFVSRKSGLQTFAAILHSPIAGLGWQLASETARHPKKLFDFVLCVS